MRVARHFAALAAGFLLVAGCGGEAASDVAAGADVAPASADAFLAFDTDFDGEQWQAAEELVDRFPGGDGFVRMLLSDLEGEEGIDFEADVKPALGPEVDIVVFNLDPRADAPDVVALTQTPDEAKLKALLDKGDDPTVYRMVDDWALIAESEEVLDRFEREREAGTLADEDRFADAMEGLPEDAVLKIYVNGRLFDRLADAPGLAEQAELARCAPGAAAQGFGVAVRAEQEGVRFETTAVVEDGGAAFESYEAELPSALPAGALVYFSFNNLADPVRAFLDCAGNANQDVDRGIAQAELALGVSLEEDVLPLFENEGALAVYPVEGGGPIPTVSLVLQVENEENARETVDRLIERLSQFEEGVGVTETDVGGVEATRVTFPGDQFSLVYAVFDGLLVASTTEEGIAGVSDDGERLADDAVYEQAHDSADAPDETTGFVYANLAEGLPYLLDTIEASEDEAAPTQVRENLEPLRSLFVWGSQDDNRSRAAGLLRIE